MFNIKLLVLLLIFISTSALANDYVVKVNGIVCDFCSLGVTKKISKLPFIDRQKYDKGVDVDIANQMVTVAVKPGAALDKAALFSAIEAGGYNPVDIFELAADGSKIGDKL